MSTQRHQKALLDLLNTIESNVGNSRLVYTETLTFPGYDLGNGDDVLVEIDPTYRAQVLTFGMYEISEAIASSPTLAFGESGGDTDGFVDDVTAPAVTVRTSAADSDASVDFERRMLPGVLRTIPASQLVVGLGTDPGSATGIGTLFVTIGYFI